VNGDNSDLKRIERQKILIKRMLEEKFDFKRFAGEGVSFTAGFDFKELEHINADWEFKTLNDGKFTRTFMGKKDVLVP
jgi:hypothetical protein